MIGDAGDCEGPWCDKCYPPDVYGNVLQDGVRKTWKELCEEERKEARALQEWKLIFVDLDRNANGRHRGDVDSFVPAGISEGNPHLAPGQVLGYSIYGEWVYIVPELGQDRYDINSWRKRRDT